MKYILVFCSLVAIAFYHCNSGQGQSISEHSFFYAGNKKIEITISTDTLGVLLKDTVYYPGDTSEFYFNKVIKKADSTLQAQGYKLAGNLEDDSHIKLILLSPPQELTKNSFADQVSQLKSQQNKVFVNNAGYLVRVKGTNYPMVLTNEIIIQFKPGVTQAEATNLFKQYKLVQLRKSHFDSLEYTVAVTKNSSYDVLRMSHILKDKSNISYAQVNFIYAKKYLGVIPHDEWFKLQWNFVSNGIATEDADIDADLAWGLTMGSDRVILAVIDAGFDVNHTDLSPNFLTNELDRPGNGDEDGNGYPDDYLGWNFDGNSNNLAGSEHGTAVLGIANAVYDDTKGVVGSCPKCRSLMLKGSHQFSDDRDPFEYARLRGAKVINCSWQLPQIVPSNLIRAVNNVIDAGVSVVFAMKNENNSDYCVTTIGIDEISRAIFISRSTSKDTYDNGGYGNCMTILAPSGVFGSPPGFLKVVTTDIRGSEGFNDGTNDDDCFPAAVGEDYTYCFWGNSGAAPLVTGVAGLILSANNSLSPQQIKYLLQDCADKIENSVGKYSAADGKCTTTTHGYGRLNAYEAVKIASPDLDNGGRNGVDIFVRDHKLDWGNTEKPSSYSFEPTRGSNLHWWLSEDIKVDAPPYEIVPADFDNDFFESLPDEDLKGGQENRVYVRVRNRGFNPATNVSIKLHWADACLAFPALPSDFWSRFPGDPLVTSDWHVIGTKMKSALDYGSQSVIGTDRDVVYIDSFHFTPQLHDETRAKNHYCLMALIDALEDPIKSPELMNDLLKLNMDNVTKKYNNATHRNYAIINSEDPMAASQEITLNNPYPYSIITKPVIEKGGGVTVHFSDSTLTKPFQLKPGEKKLISLKFDLKKNDAPTEITIKQIVYSATAKTETVVGGITYSINPPTKKTTH